MLSAWLDADKDYDRFWTLTPKEVSAILTGHNNALLAAHDAARVRNHELAGLIAFAHHEPAKMPKYKATGAREEKKSDEADQARVRGLLIAMSLHSKRRR